MATKLNLIVFLLVMIGAASSCTKEETTIIEYEPITIAGRWHVTSWYDAQLQTIENYPAILDSTVVTFTDTGRVNIKSACTGGSGYYLQTQTKEIQVSTINTLALFCGTLENGTQNIILNALENAYSFDLENENLTIRSSTQATPYVYMRKLD